MCPYCRSVRIFWSSFLVLAFVSVITLTSAMAIDSAPPANQPATSPAPAKPRPARWRVMTYDDATSTSRCIGDPRTPLCAIETHMACFLRGFVKLCTLSHGLPESEAKRFYISEADPRFVGHKIEYRVTYIHRVRDTDPRLNWNVDWLKPGDIEIRTLERSCPALIEQCTSVNHYGFSFSVRRMDGRWRIAGYSALDAPE